MNRLPTSRPLRSSKLLIAALSLVLAGNALAAPVINGGKVGIDGLQFGSSYELPATENKSGLPARALSLASVDADVDGFPDLFSGHALESGGVVTVHRGNREAWAPTSALSLALVRAGQFPPGFLAEPATLAVPVAPDLMVAGDFDHDGTPDLILAERGDTAIYLLRGSRAGFGEPQKLAQPGAVDALAAGNIDRPDGFADLAVAVSNKAGAGLQIYTAGIDARARSLALPAAATELHVGQADSSPMGDIVALADARVHIVHGVDRSARATAGDTLETLDFPFAVQALALGNFIWDRDGNTELALLKDDGSIQIATRGVLKTTPFTVDEIRAKRRAQIAATSVTIKSWQPGIDAGWRIAESIPGQMSKASTDAAPRLIAARLSGGSSDDLLALDALGRAINITTFDGGKRSSAQLPATVAPVAVLSLQTSALPRAGLVVLGTGAAAVTLAPAAPSAVFTVTKTADTNDGACDADCSLREAIAAANAAPDADSITLPAGTYQLTLANAGGLNEDGNATGDLDVNNSAAIIGADVNTTFVQAGTNTSNGIDKVFAINPLCITPIGATLTNVTVRFGRNTQANPNPLGDFSENGGGIDACNTDTGSFTMLTVNVDQNTNVNAYGGGVNFDSVLSAAATWLVSGGSITGNRTISAASVLKNGGGFNLFADAHNVSFINATISGNTSAAEGGGMFVRHTNGGTIQFSGGSISNNTAASRGGGVSNANLGTSSLTIDNDSVINANVSQGVVPGTESRGGGVFVSSAGSTTIREVTITGNQANTGTFQGGGGIAAISGNIVAIFNRIAGNTAGSGGGSGFHNAGANVVGTRNWWGCNAGPASAPCDLAVAPITFPFTRTPHLVLRHIASPSTIVVNQTSTLTADFLRDSTAGVINVADLDALIGTTIAFNNPVRGTLSAAQTTIQATGAATATFTATTPGPGLADAVVDAQTTTTAITINQGGTTTAITADTPDPSPINTPVTVNYTVTPSFPGAAPTGNVTVSDTVDSCTATVAAGTCNITLTTAGPRTLTATYVGDTNFAGSASAGEPHNVTNLTADLSITKTDGAASEVPGTSVTYTITASNPGPDPAASATVADTFPAICTGATWTCVGAGGGTCAAAGAGNINQSVSLPVGASVTFTATCQIAPNATGTLVNTATVSSTAVTDPTPGNNSATDTDTLVPSTDVSITKTNGTVNSTPGGSTTYTIVASNSGPSTATGVTVADTFPAILTCNSTSVAAGGASGNDTPIAGNINDSGISMPPGSTVTYTAVCGISAAATGALSNTATVSAATTDPSPGNNSATDTDTLVPSANLGITKTDGVTTAIPGGSVTYTITASNAGPSNVPAASVVDSFDSELTCTWTCVGAGGGTCAAAGAGNIGQSVNLPSGGSVTFTASCSISPAATGTLTNTATVSSAVTDPVPGNNSATDSDTLVPTADLAITKTDGSATAIPGSSTTYTITASNSGPSNANGATVADTFPATLTCTWTCVGAGGGTCTAAGAGNISQSVNLPAGASTTFTAVCAISGAASGSLVNTATVTAPGGVTDPTPGNNSATDTDNLVAGPPSQLAFGQQPVNTAGGATITPSPTVRILDQFGNLTTSTANVTIAIGTNPAGGALSGTTTVAAVAGVATFNGLSINTAGTGYTLAASSTGLTGATSNPFNITVGAAAQLAFGQQPTNSITNVAISPAPTVRILDAGGNLTASTANVTVAIGTNPGAGTLAGTTTVAAVAGVASFSTLAIDNPGVGYTLTAASTGLLGATSTGFNVACAPTLVTNNNDSGAGSLRQAIATACTGSTITFDASLNGQTIVLASELVINRSLTIQGNVPVTISGNNAARVFNVTSGNVALSDLTIANGRSTQGAGINVTNTATLALTNSTIRDNVSTNLGGGIYSNSPSSNCTGTPSVTIRNSTITGNTAATLGGGVRNVNGLMEISNSTITNNTAPGTAGGGVASFNDSVTCTRVGNTIVSGNSGGDVAASTTTQRYFSLGNNLVGTAGTNVSFTLEFNQPGDQVNVTNALLAPLANYGGNTQTHALRPGSPAINAGNNAGAPATDQRGIARPQQGTVDIGAYESRGFTLAVSGGNNQSAGPGLAFANPLLVTVTPIAAGEPVNGGQVTFTPPGAGASASLAPNPATISGGSASTTATANATIGTYTVSANAAGAAAPVNFTLTNAGADLSINDVPITEGNAGTSNAVFTVTRTNSLTAFSVPYSITAGTAQAGIDYTTTSGTLNFAVGGPLTQTITVPVVGDLIVEPTETATLNLGAVTNITGVTTTTDGSGLLTITDNDSAVVAFNPIGVSQTEATSPMAFTVTLSNPVQSGVTLSLNSAFGTATAADFTPIVGGTVTFAPNTSTSQIVNVAINNDALDENDETFTLTLSSLTAVGNVTLGAGSATGTILDDDLPPVISITSPSQLEGDAGNTPMNFVVSLSAVSGLDVSFTRATADGTATVADNDYLALAPAVLTIPAGQSTLTIPVQIVGNTLFEGNESFSVNLTGIGNATPASITGTGTIEDDDQQPTTTTITSDGPDPSVVGQPYAVAVTVTAQTTSPLGTVTISDGTDSCGPVVLTTGAAPNSSAGCNLTSTTAGAKTLTATYTAASTAFADSSGTTTHQVNAAATAISVSGPARSRINQPTTFAFALSVNAPGAGSPAGTVTLSSGAISCQVVVPTATPSCALTFDTLGPRTVAAAFVPSDGNFLGSASSGAGNAQTLVYALSDIAVTKSDAVGTYVPGELLLYTVTVRNLGPDAAANIRVRDQVPAGLVDVEWTCDASGGVACPQNGGSGSLDMTVAAFPVGGLLNFSFFGNVSGSPGQIVNTALVELPADTTIEDPVLGNNSATDTDLLEFLFRNGFEDPVVNAPAGAYRLPSNALRGALDGTARVVYLLDDANGLAVRVYARLFDNEVQYALAGRGSNGQLRLGAWASFEGEPTLTWTARPVAGGWILQSVELR